jgi:uncharacterized protein YndB with AHSA1/START domain
MPEKAAEARVLRRQIHVNASPETVFSFLTDPAKVTRWMGRMVILEPRPGGVYRCVFNERDIAAGKIVEIKRPERLVFTWGWEDPSNPIRPGTSTVEITLKRDGDGTVVSLTHTGLPAAAVDRHAMGWQLYLDRLAVAATGGDPGPDPNEKPRDM